MKLLEKYVITITEMAMICGTHVVGFTFFYDEQ